MAKKNTPKRRDMLPFWTDAYLADTQMLSTRQHGAYVLLIITCWRNADCRLPNTGTKLRRITGLSPQEWKVDKDDILEFWDVSECGKWITQKRLMEEAQKDKDFRKRQSSRSASKKSPSQIIEGKTQKGSDNLSGAVENKSLKSLDMGVPIAEAEAVAVADSADSSALLGAGDWKIILEKCVEAARPALFEAAIPLMNFSEIRLWLTDRQAPCDLELDIIPALQKVAARARKPITRSWGYFRPAVIENRDKRLSGLPTPQPLDKDKTHAGTNTNNPAPYTRRPSAADQRAAEDESYDAAMREVLSRYETPQSD